MTILQMTTNFEDVSYKQWFSYNKLEGNWIVDWGDGCIEVNTIHHIYEQDGIYQITVRGDFKASSLLCPDNIISLDKEEGCGIIELDACFHCCHQLISVPHDWDVSKVESMQSMFNDCVSFNQDLSHWNLEKVETANMFKNCPIEEKHKPKGLK